MGCLNDAPGSGNEHKTISYAKALKEHGAFEVFLYDINEENVKNASYAWMLPYIEYGNITCEFDVVIIATPDNDHYSRLVEALKYKPRLVICEKPLCSTVAEAEEIVKLYEDAGIPILVDYTRRFIPELQELKKHGKAAYGEVLFNRGWLHTGTHAIDFFKMLGCAECNYNHIEDDSYRVWDIMIKFEDGYIFREHRIGDMPVPDYYNHHTRYVVDNAYGFLEGKEELKCTMYDGLKALEIMERLCK
jgi:hypothetical protein